MRNAGLWADWIHDITLKHPGHPDQRVHGNWARTGFRAQAANERYNVEVDEHVMDGFRALSGRADISPQHIGELIGAPDGAHVTASYDRGTGEMTIEAEHKYISVMQRSLLREDGKLTLHNHLFIAEPDAPKGFGARVFLNTVEGARALGVEQIKAEAVGAPGEFWNGYYTWPRLGYNGKLDQGWKNKMLKSYLKGDLPAGFEIPDDLHGLFKTPQGRLWWKLNGGSINVVFDTAQNSVSSRVLRQYAERKGIKSRRLLDDINKGAA